MWFLVFLACFEEETDSGMEGTDTSVEEEEEEEEEEDCDLLLHYADLDADGFGDASDVLESCEVPSGRVLNSRDCDDSDALVYPGAPDLEDGVDQDCDGRDGCEGLPIVEPYYYRLEDWDCATDGEVVVEGRLAFPPSGDCVCGVIGALYYDAGTQKDLQSLRWVSSELDIDEGSEVVLPSLLSVGYLSVFMADSWVELPRLREASGMYVLTGSPFELPELTHARDIEFNGPELHLPALQSIELSTVVLGGPVAVADFGAVTELDSLRIYSPSTSLDLSGMTVQTLDVLAGEHGPGDRVTLAQAPSELNVGSGNFNLSAPGSVDTLVVYTFHTYAPGTVSLGGVAHMEDSLVKDAMVLETPDLLTVGDAQVDLGTWEAPLLEQADSLVLNAATPLPSLTHTDALHCRDPQNLPLLQSVGTLDCDGTFEAVDDVQVGAFGDQVLPSLTSLSVASRLVGRSGNLPALQSASAELTLEEEAELPALEYVSDGLILIDVPELAVPSLIEIDRVTLRGSTATVLPMPFDGALWTDAWQPATTAEYASVSRGVLLLDHSNTQAPNLHLVQAGANVVLRSNSWTSLEPLAIDQVDGNLKYCLPNVSSGALDAWLETVSVDGSVSEDCS